MNELIEKQELQVKEVDYDGVTMLACMDDQGIIRVGVRSICDGLGIDYSGQMQRINRDDVLPQGVCKIQIPTNQGIQETNMMDIEYLPFFLVGIKASMCKPKVRPALKEFKVKAKDVLAAAFLPQTQPMTELQILRGAIDQIEVAQRMALEAKEEAAQANQQIQAVKEAIIQTDRDWRRWVNKQLQRIGFKLGDYQGIKNESYDLLKQRGRCNLDQRLDNLRNRMRTAGSTRTQLATANYLDVIEAEPRLKEIYTAIVRELSVKYVA
jgi:hypothetical protein